MSKSSRPNRASSGKDKRPGGGNQPSPEARRKQIIVGLVMGLIMGVIISVLTEFWYWLPAGLAFGLATGAIMKPPVE